MTTSENVDSVLQATSSTAPDTTNKANLKTRNDFLFLEELGEGSFSTVFLVSEKETRRRFAIKVCYKAQILREKKVTQIFREKEILMILSTANCHSFIVQLYCTFQDKESLYFVLTYASRKDLLRFMKKERPFSIEKTKFVGCEVLSALAHIHKLNIVHRDLKPENLLVNEDGHVLLSDFGCAKVLDAREPVPNESERPRRKCSFVGTSFYVSPEVLNGEEVEQACDYWTLGVILYEMLAGHRPFSDVSEYLTYQRILKLRYAFDDNFPDPFAKDLITKLLVIEVENRLGSVKTGGSGLVMEHNYFAGVDWALLKDKPSPLLTK